MNLGDRVEVQQVWASQGRIKPTLKSWFKGYEFVSSDGTTATVRHVAGMYAGIDVKYPVGDVRPA